MKEQQHHRKATELHKLEEDQFVTEHRRQEARESYAQEQALAGLVEERRRRLAAARVSVKRPLRALFNTVSQLRTPFLMMMSMPSVHQEIESGKLRHV